MSKTKTLLVSVLAVFGTAFFIPAQAQELVPPEQETQAVTVATVNIYDAQITRQDNNNIQLTFDLSNREQIQPDVRYAVQLMKDRQILMDEQIYPETISLNENETIKKEIEYLAPSYLSGEFQLMLIARNQNGLLLAIANPGQVILKGDNQFIEINPSSCYLTVADEAGDKRYTLDQGVDIKPEEQLIATCDLTNHANNPIIFIPNFKTYWRTTFGEEVTTNKEDRSTLTLNPQEKKQISFTLPKAQAPQAYDAVLELQSENQTISNKLAFHYVLRGPSATIQNLRLDKDFYQKGQTAQASFFWSGSADNFPDSRLGATDSGQLTADITIKNADNQICAATQEALNPDSPTASYALPVKVDCPDPKIAVSIKDGQGNILDQKEFSIKSQTAPDQAKPQEALTELPATAQPSGIAGYIAIILLGLLALSILVFAIIKKRKGLPVIIFLVLAGGMFLAGGEGARGDTFTVHSPSYSNHPGTFTFTVNLNKDVYKKGEDIIAYGDIVFAQCDNGAVITDISGLDATINGSTKSVLNKYEIFHAENISGRYHADIEAYYLADADQLSAYISIPYSVLPSPPSELLSTCNSTGTNATVSWKPSSGATSYNIRYDKNSASWVYETGCKLVSEVTAPVNRLAFSAPSADASYTASRYRIEIKPRNYDPIAMEDIIEVSASGSGGEKIDSKKSSFEFARLDLVSTTGSDSISEKLVFTLGGNIVEKIYRLKVPRANGTYKIKVQGYGFGQTVPVEKEISYIVTATDPEDICMNGYTSTSFTATAVPGNSNKAWVQVCDGYYCGDATYKIFSCATSACALPWGGTIASGQSVTAYSTTPACNCLEASETRSCSNGTLSGTYTNKTCLNIPATIGACGTADGQSFASQPSDNLCASGNPSPITGTWDWTCNGVCSTTNESCHASQSLDLNWKEVNPN